VAAGLELREDTGQVVLRVRVQPRSSRNALGGERDGALVVRLTAPPVDGAANKALLRFLARSLRVAPSALRIATGAKGRDKRVSVRGLDAAAVVTRLGELMKGGTS
jgi:uncharacterized protein (TIGR00251 family)